MHRVGPLGAKQGENTTMGSTSRRWLVVTTSVVVLGVGSGAWALTRSSATSPTATAALVAATTGALQQTVAATGTIEPAQQAVLTFTVPGSVTSVPVAVGQKVAKGSILATLDPTALQTAVTTATAGVTAAEQQLASVASGSAAQVTAAQAQLAAARSTLEQAQASLAGASMTAPFSGVVATVGLSVGDVVGSTSGSRSSSSSGTAGGAAGGASAGAAGTAASSTGSTGSITLISTGAWVVDAAVGSADLPLLQKGLQARITPSGGAVVFGTVASVGIVASASSGGTATFPVLVYVTGNPAGLYAGATADVSLIVKQIPDALTVPTAAVQTLNGQTVVYRHVGGKRVATPVTLGASYGPTTQVLSGLKDGDQVEVPLGRFGRTGTRGGGAGTGGGAGAGGGFRGGFGGGGFPGGAG